MDVLQNYLINPTSYVLPELKNASKRWSKELINFDDEVYRIGKKINLSSLLKPDNYFSLLDAFIRNPHGFNPVFKYHFPSNERIESIRSTLKTLAEKSISLEQQ